MRKGNKLRRKRRPAGAACRLIGFAAGALLLAACEPKVEVRGHLPLESQLAEIDIGIDSKSEIARLIGSPSTVSTFDDNIWYYMSRRTERWAFLEPEVVEHRVLALYFDDGGVLQHMQTYTEDDLREIELSERETPTSGREFSILEQLFGNVNRFRGTE